MIFFVMCKFSFKLAPRGALCLGIAVGLSVIGIFLADGALITLGFSALVLMLCSFVLGRSNLRGLEVDLSLPAKCYSNKYYKPHVVIRNKRSFLDAFYVKLYVGFPHGAVLSSQSNWVPARSLSSADVKVRFPMRFSSLDHPYRFVSGFPLGLFIFSSYQAVSQPLTVYPRQIVPEELLDHGVTGQCERIHEDSDVESVGEPRSIRPWQPGDPAKNIHWPASIRSLAQGHSLRVREFDPPGLEPERAVLIFHSYSAHREMMREDTFERAISLVAGAVSYFRNLNIKTELVADFMRWHPVQSKSRSEHYECLTILAESRRAVGTELHELQSALDKVTDGQQVIIISDMRSDSWKDLIEVPESAKIIDIRQVRFPVKKTLSAKAVLSRTA